MGEKKGLSADVLAVQPICLLALACAQPDPVCRDLRTEPPVLFFKLSQPSGHANHDLHAGEVHAEILNQRANPERTLHVPNRVQPDIAASALRLHQADPFVVAQSLRVDADQCARRR